MTVITTHIEASAEIARRIDEGTLARGRWTGTDNHGRHVACLLAAMAPDAAAAQSADACPAWLLPPWLAHLTPWIDDAPSNEAWHGIVSRYADLIGRSSVLDAAAWHRLDYRVRRIAVLEARSHVAAGDAALGAIDRVVELLDREISGAPPTRAEWDAAAAAARDARADAATYAATGATYAATGAYAAYAAYAYAYAANAAAVTAATYAATDAASYAAAADRICAAFLDAWADEISTAEDPR